MASSLRMITSNLITRSVRPTVFSASRVLIMVGRSYTTTTTTIPKDDSCNQSSPFPRISSIDFEAAIRPKKRRLELHIGGPEPDELLNVSLKMDNYDRTKKDGMVTFTNKDDIMANIGNNIISSFRDIATKLTWIYYDMFFNRSILGKELCPVIAMLSPTINSFSIYKYETSFEERVYSGLPDIEMCMPGKVKMKLTTQGLRVSLETYGRIKREDVKTYFDYDTFFIEGKTTTRHYITGIHLPEGIHKRHNMIKRQMKGNVFYAIIHCRVNKEEELREIKDQLKPKSYT